MTIIEKIKQSVEGATEIPFLYHAAGELNELIARCNTFPIAYSFLIDSGTIDDVNGRYHERVTLAVMFCDKTEFDFNALENEEIIDRMKVKAYKWLQSLRMSNTLRIVSINSTQRLYDNTTDILTGFAVNITIDDLAGVGECELPDVIFEIKENGEYPVIGIDKVIVSVPNSLTDLVATENDKEYLPSDYGAYGFGRVIVEIPKIKVSSISVNNACLNDGIFDNRLIDYSEVVEAAYMFNSCTNLLGVAVDIELTNKVTTLLGIFRACTMLRTINTAKFDTSNVTKVVDAFVGCTRLEYIDCTTWDFSKVTSSSNCFYNVPKLHSLIGNRTIEDVLEKNVSCLKNARYLHPTFITNAPLLDRASLRALINGLADLTGQTAKTLTLGATLVAKLTEEDIAIATSKNWTIV